MRTDLSGQGPKPSEADLCFQRRHPGTLIPRWSGSQCRRREKPAGQYAVLRIAAVVRHPKFPVFRRRLELEGLHRSVMGPPMVAEEEVELSVAPPSFAVLDRSRETK